MITTKSHILSLSLSPCLARFYSSTKPSVALLSKLRKATEVSINKGREALIATGNNYDAAVKWIQEDALKNGEKKAAKLGDRVAGEGVVTTVVKGGEAGWGSKTAMVELCCETDFVSRNENFKEFAGRIATAGLNLQNNVATSFRSVPVDEVMSVPLPPPSPEDACRQSGNASTVKEGVLELIGKLGENMNVRRFAVAGTENGRSNSPNDAETLVATYVHGGESSAHGRRTFVDTGRIGGAVLLQVEPASTLSSENRATIGAFARSLARQVVGFKPTYLSETDVRAPFDLPSAPSDRDTWLSENVLLHQPLLGGQDGETVFQAIERVGNASGPVRIRIVDFVRYEAGEGIERAETDFAEEVKKAAGVM